MSFKLDELRALTLSPASRENYSALGKHRSIVVTKELLEAMDAAPDRDSLIRCLKHLPCPIVGIGLSSEGMDVHDACDVIVPSHFDASEILANIDRAPLAAMILVQVLRSTETMPVADALTVESLAFATLQAGKEHQNWLALRRDTATTAPESNGSPVLTERNGDRLEIKLNRAESFNAISVEMRDALCEALELVVADPTIRVASISGNGRCFSIGGDLNEFGIAPDSATAHGVRSVRMPGSALSQCAERTEFNLHGACIGAGIELPAFSPRVLAAKNTYFQLPEIKFGLIPGAGGCVSIARRIGRQRTAYFALSARKITATKALEWGLVDAVAD